MSHEKTALLGNVFPVLPLNRGLHRTREHCVQPEAFVSAGVNVFKHRSSLQEHLSVSHATFWALDTLWHGFE